MWDHLAYTYRDGSGTKRDDGGLTEQSYPEKVADVTQLRHDGPALLRAKAPSSSRIPFSPPRKGTFS